MWRVSLFLLALWVVVPSQARVKWSLHVRQDTANGGYSYETKHFTQKVQLLRVLPRYAHE